MSLTPPLPYIYISDYDPTWPDRFEEESAHIARALHIQPDQIFHVGSTSVPGLPSKPLIDMLAIVPSPLAPHSHYFASLRPLGYRYRDVNDPGRHFFEKPNPFRFHIHVAEEDSWHYWRLIMFRDRLRRDKNLAERYVDLKRQLAMQFPDDRDRYSRGKTIFVAQVMAEELRANPELTARVTVSRTVSDLLK